MYTQNLCLQRGVGLVFCLQCLCTVYTVCIIVFYTKFSIKKSFLYINIFLSKLSTKILKRSFSKFSMGSRKFFYKDFFPKFSAFALFTVIYSFQIKSDPNCINFYKMKMNKNFYKKGQERTRGHLFIYF